ncbi:MAG: hypothetical protein WD533_06360, partial [Dehalococcoidia bacterium]
MRQRRRAERGNQKESGRASKSYSRRISEQSRQRLLIWGAAAFGVLLVVLLIAGWVFSAFLPSRSVIANVDGDQVRTSDIVRHTRLDAAFSGQLNPSSSLNTYVQGMILRRQAEALGISVSEDDAIERIVQLFDSEYDEENPPAELTERAQDNLDTFLRTADISESDFRFWLESQLYEDATLVHFQGEVEDELPQVFVHWIVAEDEETAQEAFDRIEGGEEFAEVAQDLNTGTSIADENGEVGWVPEGVVTELDEYLFGEEAVYGELVGPLEVEGTNLVLFVEEPPGDQPVSDEMRE